MILVLGGTGFLGKVLCRRLERTGEEVQAVGSRELDLTGPDATAALAERLSPSVTLVLASAIAPPEGGTSEGFEKNLRMATAVAAALDDSPSQACVYISSDAVYGWSDDRVTEATPVDPDGHYGAAKVRSERLLYEACERQGVRALLLRPVAVFGPGDTHGSYGPNRFARTARENCVIELFGNGEELRDHLYVEDFAAFAGALIERGERGVFNVASGVARSFADVARMVADVAPGDVEVLKAPRRAPVTHRSFDTGRLRAAAPNVDPTDFRIALEATLAAD